MSSATPDSIWNLPNKITAARLVVSVSVFVALHFNQYLLGLILFLIAASTDWLDGYFARKLGLVTQVGRILDPLADKIIICGTFIFLSSHPDSAIPAWITVVVVGRELLVTVLRSFLEQHGRDFSANMPGKIKMVLQCAAAVGSLYMLWQMQRFTAPLWLPTTVAVLALAAVLSTIYSGILYIVAAARLIREL